MMRRTLRRIGDALLWAALGAVAASFAFATGVAIVAAARGAGTGAIAGGFYMLVVALFASFVFALPPYALLLVGWSALATRFAAAETRAGVATATAALALPAGAAMALANDGPPLLLFTMIWLPAWIGLLVPRLVVPRLAPGAFARGGPPPPPIPSRA